MHLVAQPDRKAARTTSGREPVRIRAGIRQPTRRTTLGAESTTAPRDGKAAAVFDAGLVWAGQVHLTPHARHRRHRTYSESDLVVALGARFGDRHTGELGVYRGERQFIQIDVSPEQIGRVFPPDLGIVGDARLAIEALVQEVERRDAPVPRPAWIGRLAELRATRARRSDYDEIPIRAPRVYRELNDYLPDDATVVTAIGLYQIFGGQFQIAYRPRHYLCCGQAGPLGWEVSACTGAKLARPENTVYGIVGDFSFQFLCEEVAVAVQYGVPFVLVMLNNGYMGLIRQAEVAYGMNFEVDLAFEGCDGHPGIDHVALMRAMGADGVRVSDSGEIRSSLEWATQESQRRAIPVLVEIMTDPEESAAMGPSIDRVVEPDQIATVPRAPIRA